MEEIREIAESKDFDEINEFVSTFSDEDCPQVLLAIMVDNAKTNNDIEFIRTFSKNSEAMSWNVPVPMNNKFYLNCVAEYFEECFEVLDIVNYDLLKSYFNFLDFSKTIGGKIEERMYNAVEPFYEVFPVPQKSCIKVMLKYYRNGKRTDSYPIILKILSFVDLNKNK